MASKFKRFSENIVENDLVKDDLRGNVFNWERVESEVLERFDTWRYIEKPNILLIESERYVGGFGSGSLDLIESPRYFFLRVLYDDSIIPKEIRKVLSENAKNK